MSLLAELFIGTEQDARTYDASSGPRFKATQLGGLTSLEFGTLWAVLEGVAWDVNKHMLQDVTATSAEWTFAFPEDYLTTLRNLQESQIAAGAVSWASTPEIEGNPKVLEPLIRNLVRLAREAQARRQGLFLWVSL